MRAWGSTTVGAALLALLVGRRWRELAIALVLAVAIPAPWYIHQRTTYGGQPAFPQPAQGTPLPAAFYYGLGLPTVISAPYRTNHYTRWLPVTYDGLWGDYFGVWAWHVGRHRRTPSATVTFHPSRSAKRSLVIQSLVGLVPTLLAVDRLGCSSRGRRCDGRRRSPSRSLPLLGLVGYLYFAVHYWTPDGDLLKATYMLSTVGAWALASATRSTASAGAGGRSRSLCSASPRSSSSPSSSSESMSSRKRSSPGRGSQPSSASIAARVGGDRRRGRTGG